MKLFLPRSIYLVLCLALCSPVIAAGPTDGTLQASEPSAAVVTVTDKIASAPTTVIASISASSIVDITAPASATVNPASLTTEISAVVEPADPEFAGASVAEPAETAPKSAAEIMAEIASKSSELTVNQEKPVDSEVPLNEIEETPVSADKDLEEVVVDDQQPVAVVEDAKPEKLFEKTPALEPSLMIKGAPVDEVSEINAMEKISGKIVPEKQPLKRRRNLFRWVLKTADGKRIPLKSNLKLLQEVKREKLLDGFVTLSGKFVSSGFNENLRFFIVESAVIIEELPAHNAGLATGSAAAPAIASATQPVAESADNAAAKPAIKPAAKPDAEPATKTGAKPAAKPATRPEPDTGILADEGAIKK